MKIAPEFIRKILIIKLGGLGDVFLSTIVLDNLKSHFPSARIEYCVEKAGSEAIMHDKRVNAVYVIDKQTMHPLSVIRHVRRQRYDMVIDLFGNPRSAIMTLLSGARYRVGLDYGWRRHLYSIVGEAQREKLHGAEVNLQALRAMGVPIRNTSVRFPLSEADATYAQTFWHAHDLVGKFVVGILPAGSWPSKRCEPEKFAEIAQAVAREYQARILIVWGPADEADARAIGELCGGSAIVAPKASLSNNLALLSRCTAIIATDSGPMHLACGFDVPILCLYGPTYPEGPYGSIHGWVRNEGLDCLVCNLLQCPIGHPCMRELPLEAVMQAFRMMMKKGTGV